LITAAYAVIISTMMAVMNKIIFVYQADRDTKLVKVVARDALLMAAVVVIYLILLSAGVIPVA
ncbi:MAG: hypothetical protein ACFFED_10635, partial [Candidatus Thorarchaeota archaeon]